MITFRKGSDKTVMSFKMSITFKKEIQRIALNEKVKPSNVVMALMIEGYKTYCKEKGYEPGNYDELSLPQELSTKTK